MQGPTLWPFAWYCYEVPIVDAAVAYDSSSCESPKQCESPNQKAKDNHIGWYYKHNRLYKSIFIYIFKII